MSAPIRPCSALVPRERNNSMAKHDLSSHYFQRKISDFCEVRIAPIASKRMLQSIRTFLIGLVIHRRPPLIVSGRMNWTAIGEACGIEGELGVHRLTHRNVQTQCGRSAGLLDRYTFSHRKWPQAEQHSRAYAVEFLAAKRRLKSA